jgi:signal transduction histidine kinase
MSMLAYLYRVKSYARALKLRYDTRLEERTRMARDLHDTLLQTIQGSKMVADSARANVNDRRVTVRALDRLSDWLDRASFEGRAALESLRTSNVDKTDAVEALRMAADTCCSPAEIKIHVMIAGLTRDLHPIARDEIYHIGYEAIRNTCAHAQASEMWIHAEYKRRFRLEIRDNGRGIEEEILRAGRLGHFGLIGMRERAQRLGGELKIVSSARGGTTVSLLLPGQAVYKEPPTGIWRFIRNLFNPQISVTDD